MRPSILAKTLALLMIVLMATVSVASAASVSEKRSSVRNTAKKTLNRLYSIHPSAREAVKNAAGYAVFSISDFKLVFLGGGGGKGLAVNNATRKETFMKTGDVQVGLGLGLKSYQVVFVFETNEAYENFVNNGWDVGGQATVAATDSVSGGSLQGAISVGHDVWMYQMTDKGLEASLTVGGIRYYKDSELN